MRVAYPLLIAFLSILFRPAMSSPQPAPPPLEPTREETELLAADRTFDADTAERRLEGWLAAFADGGAMLLSDGSTIVGHEPIAAVMGPAFADEDFALRWKPEEARVLIPGHLGYTKGHYEQTTRNPEGHEVVQAGTYVSLWKKQPDGGWKVVFDTGSDEGEPRIIE